MIYMPQGDERLEIAADFEMAGAIGAIDGTIIPLATVPHGPHRMDFYGRQKGYCVSGFLHQYLELLLTFLTAESSSCRRRKLPLSELRSRLARVNKRYHNIPAVRAMAKATSLL